MFDKMHKCNIILIRNVCVVQEIRNPDLKNEVAQVLRGYKQVRRGWPQRHKMQNMRILEIILSWD